MVRKVVLYLICFYQRHLRRLFPLVCRYYPSCSEYTKHAVEKYGLFRGFLIGTGRIISCHPYSKRDFYDPLK